MYHGGPGSHHLDQTWMLDPRMGMSHFWRNMMTDDMMQKAAQNTEMLLQENHWNRTDKKHEERAKNRLWDFFERKRFLERSPPCADAKRKVKEYVKIYPGLAILS
jgi:hypothetical protein